MLYNLDEPSLIMSTVKYLSRVVNLHLYMYNILFKFLLDLIPGLKIISKKTKDVRFNWRTVLPKEDGYQA